MQRPEIPADLLEYTRKFLDMQQRGWRVPDFPIRDYGVVTTIVLHREGVFQTELVIAHPKTAEWPGEHCHPNVASIEVEVFDCKGLTRNGAPIEKPDLVHEGRYLVYLAPDDYHGSKNNENGISLLSCQKWLNGVEPSSVGLDWKGAPVADAHENLLQEEAT